MVRPLKPQTDLAARLIEARQPLDRDSFAALLGVPKSTLANWEQGTKAPPLDKLRVIRQQTGISLDWLIDGAGPMRPNLEAAAAPPPPIPLPLPPRPAYNRALMHALIRLYIEEARDLRPNLSPEELADKVLSMYDRSIEDVLDMAGSTTKVA